MTEPAVGFMLRHILGCRKQRAGATSPLVVGVQGPQGIGKSFLTEILRDELISPPLNLSVALISLDDLYLPHSELARVADDHPHNPLLQGRGLPGTHDVTLGTKILNSLRRINEPDAEGTVSIPIFDKSLHSGRGDRIERATVASRPLDVAIIEGWCTGFYPIPPETIEERYVSSGGPRHSFPYRKEDVSEINELLRPYAGWWSTFDTLIQLSPSDKSSFDLVYKWRIEQEHFMKTRNGGRGMTDDQVVSFVDRYIPGYVFFGDTIENGYTDEHGQAIPPPWKGNALRIVIGAEREVVRSVIF
ncbi:P-loop containing nucleoside triphosphate hydrolase protein [Thelephora terrestris]|uniref:P-loop containing nucleoside triphosphate hydrolase protein n=1 Tax=Thelephora terrestris TaxID=56493 RepID=A0A9P6HK71_9AGAM|nr:P-loop containing nucleoside triphosphate hydrolase protein [Thelephora terrestris]